MNGWEIVASFAFGLLVNEMTDVSPWAARKLVRWAAYRWTTDPDTAAGYAEEWTAIIDERPGKLLKLLTAVQFSIGAAGRAAPRALASAKDAVRRTVNRFKVADDSARYLVRLASVAVSCASTTAAIASMVGDTLDASWKIILSVVGMSSTLIGGAFAAGWLHTKGRQARTRK